MIQLVDRGPNESLIRFTPRFAYRKLGPLECDLIHGHFCMYCNNLIQALYYTDKPIDLPKYEETRVLSQGEKNGGELLKIVPNAEDKGNYKTEFFRTPNGNAEQITLKNHVLNFKGLSSGNRDDFFEVGERCCSYTSVLPLRNETIIRELAIVAGFNLESAGRYTEGTEPPPKWIAEYFKTAESYLTKEIRTIPAVGDAPMALLIKRGYVKESFYNVVTFLYRKWDEKVEADKAYGEALLAVQMKDTAGMLAEDGAIA
jgi:hypothetical protein